jgi:beta-lactamase regulating signal transducer with metallopeptidase domain
MSALALIYMAVTPLFAKRYSEKGRYYVWLIIIIGLIIPFRPQLSNAIVKMDMPSDVTTPIVQIGNGTPMVIPIYNAASSSIIFNIVWWQIATAIWLSGVFVFLAYQLLKHYCFVKMTERWANNITDKKTLALFRIIKTDIRVNKWIELYICSSISSPLMIGLIKPRIFIPEKELSQDELSFILKHELIHYKRKDLLYKYLVLAATAIHWFNPVVYLIGKVIAVLCEMSCDTEVVKNTDDETRRHYSVTIINAAKFKSRKITALSTNFYGGKKGMKKRISSIMNTRKKKAGLVVFCLALVITVGTCFVFAANTNIVGLPENVGIVQEERDFNDIPVYQEEPGILNETPVSNDTRVDQEELQSPYVIATSLEEVRDIISMQNGSIPVTNVLVPEIMNRQASGIIITEQDLHEALTVLNEAYRLDMEQGVGGAITNLITSSISFAPPMEEIESAVNNRTQSPNSLVYDIVDAASTDGIMEFTQDGGIAQEIFDRILNIAQNELVLYGDGEWPSDERIHEIAQNLFGNVD